VDQGFHTWAAERFGEEAATAAANYLGVVTFDHDPGRLSAAFAWQRLLRATAVPPRARYVIGGWTSMLARLEARARTLGVRIELGSRVDRLPEPPVIVATSLAAARQLLGDDSLHWDSGRTLLLDLGLHRRRGDAFVISDLDEAGWAEDYAIPDPTVAPPATPWSRRRCRCGWARHPPPRWSASSTCWTSAIPAGRSDRRGGARVAPTAVPVPSTCQAGPGGAGPWSTAAMACSWPATWSPPRACSARSPSPAPCRPAAAPSTMPSHQKLTKASRYHEGNQVG
jgi:hypothetical protein